ncbi:MAG: transposase, partial [Acidobacteria bacterium]|nr:transposase [Acidobacteriota bacterium]
MSSFGQTTATGLARLLDGSISHDQVTRFLSSEPQRSAHLWQFVKPLVRLIESPDGVVIVDDSIEEKPSTDENELISWHYDHSQDRTVKGINFLTAVYEVSGVCLPLAFDLVTKTVPYVEKKTGKQKRKSALTKNDRYRSLLHVCVHNQVPFRYVLNDVWFASSDNMMFVRHTLKKEFVMPLKENRKVAFSLADKQHGRYQAVNTLDLATGVARQIWLEAVDFPVLLTKEVFTNKDGSTGTRYLVSSDLTLDYERITQLFQRRWSIEVYHKSLKQNASLEKSPTRTETTQRNHLFSSICAYVKLESLK